MKNMLPVDMQAAYAQLQLCLPDVSRETFERLEAFQALITKWNDRINLVGRSTIEQLWSRHIIDSAQLMRYIPEGTKVLTDFGSGAGFPGLMLSLLGVPDVHLVESDSRKAAFLTEASRLSPGRVHIHNDRIEALTPWKSDIITARALAPLPWLLKLCSPFLEQGSKALFLKGANAKREIEDAEVHWEIDAFCHPSITDTEAWIVQLNTVKRREVYHAEKTSL